MKVFECHIATSMTLKNPMKVCHCKRRGQLKGYDFFEWVDEPFVIEGVICGGSSGEKWGNASKNQKTGEDNKRSSWQKGEINQEGSMWEAWGAKVEGGK